MGHTVSPSLSAKLSAPVGRRAVNRKADVLAVQKLLNAAGAGIKEDGDCGRATVSAIEEYQQNWTKHPDGRVDADGITWRNLSQGKLRIKRVAYVMLPQLCGNGYYSYSPMDRQFSTNATILTILDVGKRFAEKYPDVQIGIGDMSFLSGAHMQPHKTHRNGRTVDIRPLRKDGKMLPVNIHDAEYSAEYTKVLVEILQSHHNVRSILFNGSGIAGVTAWEGHDNHLHVSTKE